MGACLQRSSMHPKATLAAPNITHTLLRPFCCFSKALICNCRASPLAGSPLVPLSPYAAGALPVRPRTPLMGPSAGPPILEMTVPLAAASRRLEGLGGTVVRIYCSDLAEEHGSRHLQSLSQGSPAASGRVSLGPDEAAAAAAQFAKAVAEGKAAAAAAGGDCRPPAAAGGSSAHEPSAPAEAAAAVQGPDGPTPAAPAGSGGSAVGLAALVDSSAAAQAPGGAACAVVGRQSPAPAAAGGEAPAGQAPTELPAPPAVPEARPAPLAVPEARPAGPQAQARNSSPSASAAPGAAGAPQGARSVSPAVAGREVSLGPVAMHMQAPVAANKGAASAIKTDPEGAQRTWPDSVPVPQQVGIPGRGPDSSSLQSSSSQPSAASNGEQSVHARQSAWLHARGQPETTCDGALCLGKASLAACATPTCSPPDSSRRTSLKRPAMA